MWKNEFFQSRFRACLNFVRHCFAVCFRGYLSVFIIDDNTKVGPRYRQKYGLGNIGEDRCGNR
ncbi:hypothetical protein DWZ81_15105 [Parabacteroides merdae]|nr:hypothetical protein DWZ81_15105 [Parabacteroides merdae]